MPAVPQRPAWADRFRTPASADLLAQVPEPDFIHQAREALSELPGVAEHLSWQGIPWRWAFTYTSGTRGSTDNPHNPLAAIVPDPEGPRLATALPADFLESLQVRRLPRAVRDTLLGASPVGNTFWVEWPLTADFIEPVLDLFKQAHAPAESPPARSRGAKKT